MGGFFGTISKQDCVNDLFYGTDYNSHLGTKHFCFFQIFCEEKKPFFLLFAILFVILQPVRDKQYNI